jgi:hypothetical protein
MSTALCPLSKRCKPFSELLPPSLHGDPTTRIHGGMRHGVNLDPAEDDVRQRLRFCVPAFVQRCAAHGKKSWRPEANCRERRDDFHLRQRVLLGRVPHVGGSDRRVLLANFYERKNVRGVCLQGLEPAHVVAPVPPKVPVGRHVPTLSEPLALRVPLARQRLRGNPVLSKESSIRRPRSGPKLTTARRARRCRAKAALKRAKGYSASQFQIEPASIERFGRMMRDNLNTGSVPFRKAYLQSLIESIEVDDGQVRIRGSKDVLEKAVLASQNEQAWCSQTSTKWRARRDSNS